MSTDTIAAAETNITMSTMSTNMAAAVSTNTTTIVAMIIADATTMKAIVTKAVPAMEEKTATK